MNRTIAALLRTALTQVTGHRSRHIWTATTHSGKLVVIDGDRVVKVVDLKREQKGGYAK